MLGLSTEFHRVTRASFALGAAITGALALAIGCGATPDAKPPAASATADVDGPGVDVCARKPEPPESNNYREILKDLRCDQDLYSRMAFVAGDLGVECDHCHVPKPGPKIDFEYPKMTENKQIALFMNHEFINGLKQKDGKPMKCRSCHMNKKGEPAAKFLGEPRDPQYALEWMNLVMVNKFTHLDGSKLKCKDCHVGNIGTAEFQPKVILHADQIKLPGITPFVRYPDDGNGAPPGAAAPSTTPTAPPTSAPSAAPSAKPSAQPTASASAKPPMFGPPSKTPGPVPSSLSSSPTLFPPSPQH